MANHTTAGTWSVLADKFIYQPATDRLAGGRFGNGQQRMLTFDSDHDLERLVSPGVHGLNFEDRPDANIGKIANAVFP